MNTERFQYFIVLYNTRSYSVAAKRIPMSTQGLVRAMESLENDLGVELFKQNEAGVPEPTLFADKLYEYLQQWNKD